MLQSTHRTHRVIMPLSHQQKLSDGYAHTVPNRYAPCQGADRLDILGTASYAAPWPDVGMP